MFTKEDVAEKRQQGKRCKRSRNIKQGSAGRGRRKICKPYGHHETTEGKNKIQINLTTWEDSLNENNIDSKNDEKLVLANNDEYQKDWSSTEWRAEFTAEE